MCHQLQCVGTTENPIYDWYTLKHFYAMQTTSLGNALRTRHQAHSSRVQKEFQHDGSFQVSAVSAYGQQ